MRKLLDSEEFYFRYDIGIATPSNIIELKDSMNIIKLCSSHFTIHAIKSELDQLCDGLSTMGVLRLLKANNTVFHPLFLSRKPTSLTADQMINMFVTRFSPQGSNIREKEEAVSMKWIQYLQMIEGS